MTNSLKFGVIKLVIEDFRKEYYNTIGIDISEEKEEDVSVNRVRYFDKYLNDKEEIKRYITILVYLTVFENINTSKDYTGNVVEAAIDRYHDLRKYYFDLLDLGNKTQEQQEVYFEENKESLKSNNGLSEDYSSAIEKMGEAIVTQTNNRSSSPVSDL